MRFIVGRTLLAPRRRRLVGSRFDCITWRGRAVLSCGDEKKQGRVFIPRPLAWLLFLAAADYAPVSACLHRMSLGPHRLIRLSSHPLSPCPSHPLPTGSAACLIRSPLSSSHRLAPYLVSPGSPYYRQAGRGENAILIGGRTSAADGGRRAVSWMLACLGWRRERWRCCRCGAVLLACHGGDGRGGRSSLLPSHRLNLIGYGSRVIKSAWVPGHPIDGNGFFFFFFFSFPPDPLPPALLGLLALGLFPPPSPAGGCAGCGMACGGGRLAACLRSSSPRSALSLPLVRLLLCDPCRSCRSFLLGVLWGVLWAILPAILSALAFFKTCP